ncbi:hypothetical protein M413DRAFT_408501 [Hebeloma cylindrosporum]|uniref:F-box domain-containing protein n=1 Tax=Hebeloma cylindrosporum TaxID=76867 RepID=A0A0C2XYC3_HEBCY|nr:hypothetical protein M413DRAFT_408501 [Hebeloma cylindrosporum h7]
MGVKGDPGPFDDYQGLWGNLYLSPEIWFDDVDTLRSLSLCCSDLRLLSQRRIFHTVDIKHYHRDLQSLKKILRLHAVLQSSPRIADYVRAFEFCFLRDDITPGPASTITKVGAILSRLHRVKALVWIASVNGSLDWVSFCANDTYKDLAQAILGVLPNLTFLKIDKIQRFPLDMMAGGNVLLDVTEDTSYTISLAIVSNNDCDWNGRDATSLSPCIRIRHYNIGHNLWPRELKEHEIESVNCLRSFHPPLPPFDFSHLQTLQVTWQGSGAGSRCVKDTQKIINCTVRLKEFTCAGCSFTGLSRVIQSQRSGSLTALNLKVTRSTDLGRSQRKPLATLCRELSILGSHNHLERLTITIDLLEYTSAMHQRDLQAIDVAIARGDQFLSLKAVDLLIDIVKVSALILQWLAIDAGFGVFM